MEHEDRIGEISRQQGAVKHEIDLLSQGIAAILSTRGLWAKEKAIRSFSQKMPSSSRNMTENWLQTQKLIVALEHVF